jgi:hypothetical protein
MQVFCSVVAATLILATPGECKTPIDDATPGAGTTNIHYAGKGLPRLPSLPKLPSLPRLPRLPRI